MKHFFSLNVNHNLTESDFINIDIESQLEQQIEIQEAKKTGWIFDKIRSMKIKFYETGELNDSSYVKTPLRSNAILNIGNNDKYCFLSAL